MSAAQGRTQAERARASVLRDLMRQQSLVGMSENIVQHETVSDEAMARVRALVARGPVVPAPGDGHEGAGAQGMNPAIPYVVEARKRLLRLEDPPATRRECDELREQLELCHLDPASYGIGETALQAQTYRAYVEALIWAAYDSNSSFEDVPFADDLLPPQVPGRQGRALNELGFSDIDVIHIGSSGIRNLDGTVALSPVLLSPEFGVNHIAGIAIRPDGHATLAVMDRYIRELTRLGHGMQDIAYVAGEFEGVRNLRAVLRLTGRLRELGFRHGQIANMAARFRGDRNLEQVVAEPTVALLRQGFPTDGIECVAAHLHGSRNVEKLVELYDDLRALGFSEADIIGIGGQVRGDRNLEAAHGCAAGLGEHGFAPAQVAAMARQQGGYRTVRKMAELAPAFERLGILPDSLSEVATHPEGDRNLERLHELAGRLRELGFSLEDIVRVASFPEGDLNLQTMSEVAPRLAGHGLSNDDIVRIAAFFGGYDNLSATDRLAPRLLELGMQLGELVELAAAFEGDFALRASLPDDDRSWQ